MVDVFRNWLSETSTLIVGRPDEHKGQVARAARDEAELLASAGYTPAIQSREEAPCQVVHVYNHGDDPASQETLARVVAAMKTRCEAELRARREWYERRAALDREYGVSTPEVLSPLMEEHDYPGKHFHCRPEN